MKTIMEFKNWLEGKKTYIMAFLLFVYAVSGVLTHHLTVQQALELVWGSATLASVRAAIAKV